MYIVNKELFHTIFSQFQVLEKNLFPSQYLLFYQNYDVNKILLNYCQAFLEEDYFTVLLSEKPNI